MPANKNMPKKGAEQMLNYKAVYIEACRAYEYEYVVCESEGGSSNRTYN
jgi:hypothetical protein